MSPGQYIVADPQVIAALEDALVGAQAIEPTGIPLAESFDGVQPRLVGGQIVEKRAGGRSL
jgi:hypothetical protein